MKMVSEIVLFFILIFSGLSVKAQYDPDKVCRIENGRIIFSLNTKWTAKERQEVEALFDLDSALVAHVFKGETNIIYEGDNWKVVRVKPTILELSKSFLSKEKVTKDKSDDLFLLVDKWMNFSGAPTTDTNLFGVNNFKIENTFVYRKSAWFYLAGNKSASKVYISGSFNQWSTTQNPMKAVDSGWTVDLDLRPGKYTYKFIVDGKWLSDPYNNLREKDGAGGYNSVVYCPNYIFKLKGYETTRKVVVTGNFLNWDPKGLDMRKNGEGWSLPIYLRDGTYAYKFIADGKWITDAANRVERKDNHGNVNSVLSIGEPYLFKLEGHTDARKVILTGSFDNWGANDLLMDKTDWGWQIPYVLPAGNYEYKFIVDGNWMIDPGNPFSTGSGNFENSFIALKTNHLFELDGNENAKEVIVTGSFNNWSTKEYRMKKVGKKWLFPLYLRPGKYTYKFIIDKKWSIDPANSLYEQNEVNTYNSVLWIEP